MRNTFNMIAILFPRFDHPAIEERYASWQSQTLLKREEGVEFVLYDAQEPASLAAGLIDEVRMDVVPVVFGSGKRYFGSVHAQHLLEDPDVVIQGNRVLHLRYRVRR